MGNKETVRVFENRDCMEAMKEIPDDFFDLANGIDVANMILGSGNSKRKSKERNRKWKPKDWDKEKPGKEYFVELFRISRNQIIWGGNYFELPTSRYFAILDKGPGMYGRGFAECEYAWVRSGAQE